MGETNGYSNSTVRRRHCSGQQQMKKEMLYSGVGDEVSLFMHPNQ